MAPNRVVIALKSIRQLGLSRVALYGLYRLGLLTGYFRWVTNDRPRTAGRGLQTSVHGLFSLPDSDHLRNVLGKAGQSRLLTEAGEIMAGTFRPFGGEPVPLELSFEEPLSHWTAYENHKVSLPSSKFPVPDVKLVWEPARFGWAYVLGRAYHLTQDERYAEAFWRHTETFLDANPPYLGPHWMNGQEVAIRLMALIWAQQVFEPAAASSAVRRARMAEAVVNHAGRIPPTLLYARAQNNNHLLTEAAALYGAGLACGQTNWRAQGWRWLNRALQSQISGFGEYIQHSANYHRVMLSTALWVNAIRKTDWPYGTKQALGRATHWLFSLLDPGTGQVPNLGANDGAVLLPLAACPFHDYRPVVQAGARAFLRFQLDPGPWDETSLWLGLATQKKTYESGLYLGDHLRGRDSWAYLRASSFRSRLGHMDQLHLDLWWRGLNLAQDAGTYLYNGEAPWDNPLVSSLVHNTVTVDGNDQMTRGGRFLTLDWFPAFSKRLIATEEEVSGRVMAYHKGYRGVRHVRTLTVFRDESWQVLDVLTAQRSHLYRLHWLLPDWKWELEHQELGFKLRLKSPHGWIRLKFSLPAQFQNTDTSISLVRAGELVHGEGQAEPFEGWVSPTYAHKSPALSLAWQVRAERQVQFTTEFILSP
jgi:hypothetical protein